MNADDHGVTNIGRKVKSTHEKSGVAATPRDDFFKYRKGFRVSPYKTYKYPLVSLYRIPGLPAAFGDFCKLGSEKIAKISGIS